MKHYEARKVHPTALQKRLHPEWAERPWVVLDTETNRITGRRRRTQHDAERSAAALNTTEARKMNCSDTAPHGPHRWKDEHGDVHNCPGR